MTLDPNIRKSWIEQGASWITENWLELLYAVVPVVGFALVGVFFSLGCKASGWISFIASSLVFFVVFFFRQRQQVTQRKLVQQITDLLQNLKQEGQRYAELEQNYADASARNQEFRRFLLKILATELGFGSKHRISVFIYQEEGFLNYCRYSSNQKFTMPGRPIIPKDEPVLKEAWEHGLAVGKPQIKNKDRIHVSRMGSRQIFGYRIDSSDLFLPLGVAVFESIKSDPIHSEKNISVIEKHKDLLRHILSNVDK
jgi:hypothetical protein